MKYIDAELLRKEIETLKDRYTDIAIDSQMGWVNANFVIDDLERLQSQIDFLQQEQPNDVRAEIKEYYGEDLAFEDERAKAAYHFFSSGKAFELREYEEERKRHITDLLDAAQKGMKAGYEKAISELKEGKVECSPIMKELIDKLFGIGNTFNFGFGPKNIQQEQPETDLDADIEMEWDSFNKHLNESGEKSEHVVWLNWNSFADVARYFYELGLKAK